MDFIERFEKKGLFLTDLHEYGREETKMTKKEQLGDSGQESTMRQWTGNADEGVRKRNVLPDIKKIGEGYRNASTADINRYISRIERKQYVNSRNLRVMLVGQEGVGKTCLCKNLLAKNLDGTESTDGISIYIQRYVIDMATFKRFELKNDKEASAQKLKELFATTTKGKLEELLVHPNEDYGVKPDITVSAEIDDLGKEEQRSHLDASKSSKRTDRPHLQYTDGIQNVLDETDTDISSIQEKCFASFWDFGGQEDYYNTHHIFLTSDAVYLVVFNMANFCSSTKTLSDKEIERVTYWLQSVVSYSTDEDIDTENGKHTPPIVLIGTHLDQVEDEVTDEQIFVDKVKMRLKEDPRSKAIIETHVTGIFTVSNTKINEEVFKKVWGAILFSAHLQSQWEKPLPAWWLERERVLMSKKQDDEKVQTFQEVKEILRDMKNADNSDEDVSLFLRYMHLTGNIIVCESVQPWSIVIDPQWLADAFKEFITTPKHMDTNVEVWKQYWDSGKLPLRLIRLAWNRNTNARYQLNERILLETMKQFGLIVELSTKNKVKEQTVGQDYHEDTEFVVPCKLPLIGPDPFKTLLERQNVVLSSTLCFKFKSNFIQNSLYDKFIAHCMLNYRSFNWKEGDSSKLIQRRFICLESSKDPWKMILCCNFNVVKVTLFNVCSAEIQSGTGYNLMNELNNILQHTLDITHQTHLEFFQKLHCNFIALNDDDLVDPTILLSKETECHCREKRHGNLTESDYNFWFDSSNNKKSDEFGAKDLPVVKQLPLESAESSQLIDQEDAEATGTIYHKVLQPDNLIHSLRSAMKLQDREQLSQIEKELCYQFKQHISERRYLLYDTWVGYIANGFEAETDIRNVRIVALYDHQELPICSLPDKFKCFPIYWREKDSVSKEATMTARRENIHINLKTKLSKETIKNLFKNHSNLTMVHPSSLKSVCFGTVDSDHKEKACIALYCHVKGIIPLGETEFDKKVDGVITDVREGFCRLNANEKLCPGTGITSSETGTFGTVGAFVEDNSGRTAFLTAAHVVVPNSLWKTSDVERQQYVNSPWIPVSVCKNEKTDEQIGKVINWCFFEGAENQKCVDAALVEVDKQNISTENMFPQNDDADWEAAGYDSDELPKICASKLLKFTEINDKTSFDSSVLKYGLRTGITLGHFVYDGACIKVHNPNITYNAPVIMYGLVGVQGRFKQHFGQPGDSGALCCLVDKQDRTKIHPFGLVVAGCEDIGISFVTHLEDVFQMLNLDLDQGIKFYPSSDPTQRQNQTYHGQSNSRANAPETSSHDSSSLEQTIKKMQNELVEQKKNTDKRFENMDSKLDALLAHFALQTPRTPGKDEQQSHEEMEEEESL